MPHLYEIGSLLSVFTALGKVVPRGSVVSLLARYRVLVYFHEQFLFEFEIRLWRLRNKVWKCTHGSIVDVNVGPERSMTISRPESARSSWCIRGKYSPDVLSVTNHTRSAPVNASFDEVGHLLALRVAYSLFCELGLVDTVDGAGQNNEGTDEGLLVSLDNFEVDVPVESCRRERIEEKDRRLARGVCSQVGVDGLARIGTPCVLSICARLSTS